MVKRNSALGRALEAHSTLREGLPGHGALLDKIAGSDDAGPEFDRVVARAKPGSADELANRLLYLVVMTALRAGMAAPRGDCNEEDGARASVVVERRTEIAADYDKLFEALNLLAGAFGVPDVRILPPPEDAPRPRPGIVSTGFVPDKCPELLLAFDAWQIALGQTLPATDDPRATALRNHVRFQTKEARLPYRRCANTWRCEGRPNWQA